MLQTACMFSFLPKCSSLMHLTLNVSYFLCGPRFLSHPGEYGWTLIRFLCPARFSWTNSWHPTAWPRTKIQFSVCLNGNILSVPSAKERTEITFLNAVFLAQVPRTKHGGPPTYLNDLHLDSSPCDSFTPLSPPPVGVRREHWADQTELSHARQTPGCGSAWSSSAFPILPETIRLIPHMHLTHIQLPAPSRVLKKDSLSPAPPPSDWYIYQAIPLLNLTYAI